VTESQTDGERLAARGMAKALYPVAQRRFWNIFE
jgi:hypothetical protein